MRSSSCRRGMLLLLAVSANAAAQGHPASTAAGQFAAAEAEFARFDAVALEGRGAVLEQRYNDKLATAQSASKAYSEVCRLGDAEWCARAKLGQGRVFERFADALDAAPCPTDVREAYGDEGCDLYKGTLVDKMAKMREKAFEAYSALSSECKAAKSAPSSACAAAEEGVQRVARQVPAGSRKAPPPHPTKVTGRGECAAMEAAVRIVAGLREDCGGKSTHMRVSTSVPEIGRISGCEIDGIKVLAERDEAPDTLGVRMRVWREGNRIRFGASFGPLRPPKCPPGLECFEAGACGTARGSFEKQGDLWTASRP